MPRDSWSESKQPIVVAEHTKEPGLFGKLLGRKTEVINRTMTLPPGADTSPVDESSDRGVRDAIKARIDGIKEGIEEATNLKKQAKKLWDRAIERRYRESDELKAARNKAKATLNLRDNPMSNKDLATAAMVELEAKEQRIKTEGKIMKTLGFRQDPRDYKQAIYAEITSNPTKYGIRGEGRARDRQVDEIANMMTGNIVRDAKGKVFTEETGAAF